MKGIAFLPLKRKSAVDESDTIHMKASSRNRLTDLNCVDFMREDSASSGTTDILG